jgi:hypothetical protein
MTVRELIEALQQMPPDAHCVVVDPKGGDEPVCHPVLCCTEYVPGEVTIDY